MIVDLAAEPYAAHGRTRIAHPNTAAVTGMGTGALDRLADRLLALPAEPHRAAPVAPDRAHRHPSKAADS